MPAFFGLQLELEVLKMEIEEAKTEIAKLESAILRVTAHVTSQNREMNDAENEVVTGMQGHVEELNKYLPQPALTTQKNGILGAGMTKSFRKPGSMAIVEPGASKSYANIFGKATESWTSMGGPAGTSFFSSVESGRHVPGLHRISATMTESAPETGGFLVPEATSALIMDTAAETDFIFKGAWIQPMPFGNLKVRAFKIGDHSVNIGGGFVGYWKGEESGLTEADPQVREIALEAKKLTGLVRMTNELVMDSNSEDSVIKLVGAGIGAYRLKAWISGTGASEPLGYLNSNCLVSVTKESGQSKDTILWQNITKIMSQFYMPEFHRSIWVCNPNTIPQLLSLSQAIGLAGSTILPAVTPDKQGNMTLLTRPIRFSEYAPTLGNLGDISLISPAMYLIGLTQDIRFDKSIHAAFTTDESLYRAICRVDGLPAWDESLTLASGQKVSPFVTLKART